MFTLLLLGLWPHIARADQTSAIELENGAQIYANEAAVDDVPRVWNRRYWSQSARVCGTAEWSDGIVRGKATLVKPGLARVELDQIPKGCAPEFQGRQKPFVYVRTNQIKFKDADGNVVAAPDAQLNDDPAKTEAGFCDGGPECRHGDDLKSILGAMARKGPIGDEYQKDSAQQELYFKCHSTDDQANYDKVYRELFDAAEKSFVAAYDSSKNTTRGILNPNELQDAQGKPFYLRVSSSALKCLSLRESRWDPKKVSPTGAVGITQQVSQNVADVKCRVHGCEANGGKPEKWADDLWGNYFDILRKDHRAAYKAGMTDPRTGKTCHERMMTKDDAVCPANSIAAGAINAMLAQASIRRNSFLKKSQANVDLGGKDAYYALVIAAAANNAGSGTLAKAIASGEKPTEWLKHLDRFEKDPKRAEEIRNYAKYMDHCMKKDDFAPVDPIQPGQEKRDWKKFCEEKVRPSRTASK